VWGTVLIVALMAVPDPVRIGVAILLMSRPRPMRNLFFYWLAAMAVSLITVLSLLTLLRNFAPTLAHQLSAMLESPIARHIQIAGGALALALAATIVLGFSARQAVGEREDIGGGSSTVVLQRKATVVSSRLASRTTALSKGGLFWLAVAVGCGIPPEFTAIMLTAILASGAAMGTQITAAIVFVVIMLALIEVPLITYLFKPARTEATMVQLCNWVMVHRRRIMAVMLAIAGVWLLGAGVLSA
jgi:hypothetical protein